jgi:hypothetical protein
MKRIALSLAIVMAASFAQGQTKETQGQTKTINDWSTSGDYLIKACGAYVRMLDSGNADGHGMRSTEEGYLVGMCQGAVGTGATAISEFGHLNFSSDPPSLDQLVRVVQKYLVAHPEKLNEFGFMLINNALVEAFPSAKAH